MSQAASVEVLQRSCLDVIYIQGFLGKVFGSHFFIHRFLPFSVGITCFFFDFGKIVEQFAFVIFLEGGMA